MPRLESFANALPKMFNDVDTTGRLEFVVKPDTEATTIKAARILCKEIMCGWLWMWHKGDERGERRGRKKRRVGTRTNTFNVPLLI